LQNRIAISVRFSFFFFLCFCSFRILLDPEECWHFLSIARSLQATGDALAGKINKLAASESILDKIFVRRYLIAQIARSGLCH